MRFVKCTLILIASLLFGPVCAQATFKGGPLYVPGQGTTCGSLDAIVAYVGLRVGGKTPSQAVDEMNKDKQQPVCQLHLGGIPHVRIAWRGPDLIGNHQFYFVEIRLKNPDGSLHENLSYISVPCGGDYPPCPKPSSAGGK